MIMDDIRPNWREIDVVDLTDAEVAQMSNAETRWCLDLLHQRHLKLASPPVEVPAVEAVSEPLDIDAGGIAVMATGIRILIYPGEGANEDCFAGHKLGALTEKEIASNSYVSCLWDRSQVRRIEAEKPSP